MNVPRQGSCIKGLWDCVEKISIIRGNKWTTLRAVRTSKLSVVQQQMLFIDNPSISCSKTFYVFYMYSNTYICTHTHTHTHTYILLLLLLLLLLPGAELSLIAESFGLLIDLLPFLSILDSSCPIFDLHLANVLFDVSLTSVLGSSLWSFGQGFTIKYLLNCSGVWHSLHLTKPA